MKKIKLKDARKAILYSSKEIEAISKAKFLYETLPADQVNKLIMFYRKIY